MKYWSIAISLIALISACSSGEEEPGKEYEKPGEAIPITLSCGIGSAGKARATDYGYETNDRIGLFVVNYNGGKPGALQTAGNHVDNMRFTYDGTWTPEDMLGFYEETGLPVFDPNMSRSAFLEYYLAFNGNSYIDGEARFDSAQFEALLEYASALPERSTTDMNVDLARVYTGQQLSAVEYGDAKLAVTLCMEEGSIPGGCVQLGFPLGLPHRCLGYDVSARGS